MEKFNDGVIDLSQFRKKKEETTIEPLFTEPTIITLGDPADEDSQVQYLLLVNLVINDKQFLALESLEKEERGQVAVVEAIVEEGQFSGVQAVQTDEEYEEVVGIMTQALESTSAQEGSNHDTDH